MNKWMFYCPHCGCNYRESNLPDGTVPNLRDGFGRSVRHYECAVCRNLDAGFMLCDDDSEKNVEYCKAVIGFYQGIRGFSKKIDKDVT